MSAWERAEKAMREGSTYALEPQRVALLQDATNEAWNEAIEAAAVAARCDCGEKDCTRGRWSAERIRALKRAP